MRTLASTLVLYSSRRKQQGEGGERGGAPMARLAGTTLFDLSSGMVIQHCNGNRPAVSRGLGTRQLIHYICCCILIIMQSTPKINRSRKAARSPADLERQKRMASVPRRAGAGAARPMGPP